MTRLNTRNSSWIVVAIIAASVVGCGSAPEEQMDPAPTADGALGLGSRGEEVRSTYEYLTRYGYFESAELRQRYPDFAPIVARAPADPSVFDEHLLEGLLAFQRLSGLETTGVIDAPTRQLMETPRCAHPDVDPQQVDPSQKWALWIRRFTHTNLTFGFQNYTARLTQAETRAAMMSALNTWANASDLTFAEVAPASADIEIGFFATNNRPGWLDPEFKDFDGPGKVLAATSIPAGSMSVYDEDERWTVASPTPPDGVDLESVALHEFGHSLGLWHSSVGQPVMYPFYTTSKRALLPDDRQAIGALYASWERLNGRVREITLGSAGSAYALGTNAVPGGYPLLIYVNTNTPGGWTWANISGAPGAVHVADSRLGIWLVNSSNQIYNSQGGFRLMPGSARDIAANGSAVWSVSNVPGPGGWMVQEWSASGQTWIQSNIAAARIAVGPGAQPWVIQTNGNIYRKNGASWELLPGEATDIDVGADGSAWIVGTGLSAWGGGNQILVWNEQAQIFSDGEEHAPARRQWVSVSGGATAIAVGPDGRPWIANNASNVYRRRRD